MLKWVAILRHVTTSVLVLFLHSIYLISRVLVVVCPLSIDMTKVCKNDELAIVVSGQMIKK